MCKDNKIIGILFLCFFLSLSILIPPSRFVVHLFFYFIIFCLVLLLLFGYSPSSCLFVRCTGSKTILYTLCYYMYTYQYILVYAFHVHVHMIWFQCRLDDKSRYVGSAFHRICFWQVKVTKNTSRSIRFLFVVQHIIVFVCDQGKRKSRQKNNIPYFVRSLFFLLVTILFI